MNTGKATHIVIPLIKKLLSCEFEVAEYARKKKNVGIKIIPSSRKRMEIHEKTAAGTKKVSLLNLIALWAKYPAHARRKMKAGSRITYATQLVGKGDNAKAKHPQKATRLLKRSFDIRYSGMIDRTRKEREMNLAANTQSEIKK
ncbi:MAG: hypothetical protein MUP22_14055 [Desulfobacterales bacterium]|nr:hypothetical protein [Desulfobacterales bacterium]